MLPLTPEEKTHTLHAKSCILEEIRRKGPLSFEEYMSLALYAPSWGYYRNNKVKLGEKGDFVTAPEISNLFSHSLARQCAQIAQHLPEYTILELGAGSGIMARDILLSLAEQKALPHEYCILELSGALKATQKETLSTLPNEVFKLIKWLDSLPSELEGIILANEVMDAMPVNRIQIEQGQLRECYVTEENGELNWTLKHPTHPENYQHLLPYFTSASPYTTEVNLNLAGWLKSLSGALKKGVIFLIDYGYPRHEYYHPDRHMGTLMCYFHHQGHDNPLIYPGIQDITAHVDFTHVIECADAAGLELLGFTTQSAFLIANGIADDYEQRLAKHPEQEKALAKQLKLLTFPTEMGEAIKVMGLGKQYDFMPQGFEYQDHSHRL